MSRAISIYQFIPYSTTLKAYIRFALSWICRLRAYVYIMHYGCTEYICMYICMYVCMYVWVCGREGGFRLFLLSTA